MGRVYRAFQKGIDRDVAVKILHRELSANPQLVGALPPGGQGRLAPRAPERRPGAPRRQLPDGALYIVMEYLDGLSLQSALAAAGGAMPLPRGAPHRAPDLRRRGGGARAGRRAPRSQARERDAREARGRPDFVKVLDFGIARLNWGEQSMATAAGLIFGTARYISPEGAQGEQVGPQGDVYSIATMVYQMLSGRTPFEAQSAADLLDQRIRDEPPPIHRMARAAYVPVRVTDMIMRNLSRTTADRAPDARAFARALIEAASLSGLGTPDVLARRRLFAGRTCSARGRDCKRAAS
jgi:serine/threonine protein kinase